MHKLCIGEERVSSGRNSRACCKTGEATSQAAIHTESGSTCECRIEGVGYN